MTDLGYQKRRKLTITEVLRLGVNAEMRLKNADGTETTISLSELAALDSIAASDLAKIDGITNGTIAAGKAVVVDANKDAGDFRNVDCVNLDAGASGTAGSVDVFPSTASKGKLTVDCQDQDGDTTVTLRAAAMGQASVVSVPDPGAATANVLLTDAANDGVVVSATAAEIETSVDGCTATAAEINAIADVSARVQELTVTGAVTSGVQMVELNHASTVIAATIADAVNHAGTMFTVKNTSASGTAAHTLTLTSGTFDGTNNIATLNAPGEQLVVVFGSDGNGLVLVNTGTVGLST